MKDIDITKVEDVVCIDGYKYNGEEDWTELPIYKVIHLPNDKLKIILAVI